MNLPCACRIYKPTMTPKANSQASRASGDLYLCSDSAGLGARSDGWHVEAIFLHSLLASGTSGLMDYQPFLPQQTGASQSTVEAHHAAMRLCFHGTVHNDQKLSEGRSVPDTKVLTVELAILRFTVPPFTCAYASGSHCSDDHEPNSRPKHSRGDQSLARG